jgi:hypothetical protein
MEFLRNLLNRDKSQEKRGKQLIPVKMTGITIISSESQKLVQLQTEMFSAFPNSLVEFLAWPAGNLVKLYDQAPERFSLKSKVPVRFYLEKDSRDMWYKHLQMPSHASYLLRNTASMAGESETDISNYVDWKISGAVEDAIRKINIKSLEVFKNKCK